MRKIVTFEFEPIGYLFGLFIYCIVGIILHEYISRGTFLEEIGVWAIAFIIAATVGTLLSIIFGLGLKKD